MNKIVQIASADAYYFDHRTGTTKSHNTLFALDQDGKIWTRHFDGHSYNEWFTLAATGGLPKPHKDAET